MSLKTIGKRISIAEHGDATTILIAQTIPPSQQIALEAWFGGWLGLGGLIGYGAFASAGDERNMLVICFAFWTYFFVRILKVILWRRIGSEVIRISAKQILIKNAFKKKGKERNFSLTGVGEFSAVDRSETSFLENLDQSFWILGGDNIHFSYNGKTHVLGKQLSINDAMQLCNYMNRSVEKFQKKK